MSNRVATGVAGLDDVLDGGLPRTRMYLLQGEPGAGKTTLGLQFLLAGRDLGERGLYVTLSESREELSSVAHSHGWSLEGVDVFPFSAEDLGFDVEENTLYLPAEVELGERMRALLAEIARVRPSRLVIDSCSELRLMAQSALRLRRQLLALKERLVELDITVLLLETANTGSGDPLLQSLVHGVIQLEQLSPLYGAARRRLRVLKLREVNFRAGYHDCMIRPGGVDVFPRLVASEHHRPYERATVPSGVAELDTLLGGGLDYGTSALLLGPAGSGKSSIANYYLHAAASRGQNAAMFCFDEGLEMVYRRSMGLGIDLRPHVESGRLRLQQIDPAELSPGEFVSAVRDAVENGKASVIVIDSLNGYLHAMPEERFLTVQLHELLTFLRQRGVLTIMLMAQHGFVGRMEGPVDVSYLADTVLMTRFFEASGRVRKALSVVKKRAGTHEDTIREFTLSGDGMQVGPPLADFHGVLSGVPQYHGRDSNDLLPMPGEGS
ncbi:MAG TPA: ATPase domain-containing protein [Polyangiales bacterium]|nr:ATPase domain-containing protein [Polyangiales bacterium]